MKIPEHKTANMIVQKSLSLSNWSELSMSTNTYLESMNPKSGSYADAPTEDISPRMAIHLGV